MALQKIISRNNNPFNPSVLSITSFLFIRKNPFKYYLHFFDPILLAFASTSSSVCIHRSIETCEDKLHLNPIITRFSFPFYTALQADGSAMFITMSTIFLAYFNNYTLSISDYLIILTMASILCLSLPCVPSSSLLTILVVLASINLNVSIAPLYACEWILDRVRTAVNVYSHCICTVMTDTLFEDNLKFIFIIEHCFISLIEFKIKVPTSLFCFHKI